MRAAVLREGVVAVRETADPVPGPGQILVRTLACGICASDLHYMDNPESVANDPAGLSVYDPHADIVMGHEYLAEVVGYGPGTERRFAVGSRVSSLPMLLTSDGPRIIGYTSGVPGGFGEYFLISEQLARQSAGKLAPELVAIADAVSVGWYYVRRAAVQPNEVPLVIGCGAIGLSVIAALKRLSIGPVVAADFVAHRRRTATAMGADVVVDPGELSPHAAWREVAHGSREEVIDLFGERNLKKSVVFECVGVPGVLDGILAACERGSRILSAGGPPEGDHIDSFTAKRKGINIQFGGGPSMDDWNSAFAEVDSGRLDVRPMFGRTVSLDEVPAALDEARSGDAPPRIIVVPGS